MQGSVSTNGLHEVAVRLIAMPCRQLLFGLLLGPFADKRELDELAVQRCDRAHDRKDGPDNQYQKVEAPNGNRLTICAERRE